MTSRNLDVTEKLLKIEPRKAMAASMAAGAALTGVVVAAAVAVVRSIGYCP